MPGWVLLLTELPQLANNPASPIRMRVDNRFMYRTYRIVIQLGLLVADSAAHKGRIQRSDLAGVLVDCELEDLARRFVSSQVQRIVRVATATNDGVVQSVPQSNGEAVETGMPLTVVVEPRTSIGSPADPVVPELGMILKTETLCEP